MKLVAIALVISTLPAASYAAVSECAAIDLPLDRLACFDKEAGRTPVVSKVPAPKGAWEVQTQTSKLTDAREVFLTVAARETISCSWSAASPVYLTLRCVEGKTSAILSSACHMVSSEYNDYGKIDYRVDDSPAKSVSMQESTDNKALGLWSGGRAIPFVKQLIGKNNLIVKFTPYGSSPVTAEFTISGLDTVIGQLRETCKW